MALDVLIVDDELDIRELVAGVLEDEGYGARTAADSDSALAAIRERRPSLVLLDVWLQGSKLDGLDLLDEIKRRDPSLPVLVISGHGNLDTAVAAIRRGAADFTSPENKRVLLPVGTLLPEAHTQAVLDAAAAGKKFLSVPLFDGTGADGAQDTFVTIEDWRKPAPQTWPALSNLSYGRVHIAFFTRASDAQTPDYEIGMQYFANGVADGLAMDFGDFVMDGHLQALELRQGKC